MRGEALAIACGRDAAVIDDDDGAHAWAGEGVIGKDATEGRDRCHAIALWPGLIGGRWRTRCGRRRDGTQGKIDVAVGYDRATGAGSQHRDAPPDEAQQSRAHHAALPVDRHAHQTQDRNPGGLNIVAQHFIRVAPGQKHIRAHALGGVVRADVQNVGGLQAQQHGDHEEQQGEPERRAFHGFNAFHSWVYAFTGPRRIPQDKLWAIS